MIRSHGLKQAVADLLRCSTPFGIDDSITIYALTELQDSIGCSTPFGIDDSITLAVSKGFSKRYLCSTPFGIDDSITNIYTADIPQFIDLGHNPVLNAFRHR